MKEIWKDIKGYEGFYQVSDLGRVRSLARIVMRSCGKELPLKGRLLVLNVSSKTRYNYVNLCKKGVVAVKHVHDLVAEAFIPNPENRIIVNHIHKDRGDDRASELRWSTPKEHGSHSGSVLKFKPRPILQVSLEGKVVKEWVSTVAAERAFGVGRGGIAGCLRSGYIGYGFRWIRKVVTKNC